MSGRVTLKDIALDLGISRTTVHRALHGKEGISDQLRATIRSRAEEMGYTANYVASSLKRKTVRLAVVLPRKDGKGQYYHKYFWNSVETFLPEASSLNASIEFYSFEEDTDEQFALLGTLLEEEVPVDGLLTMPAKCDPSMQQMIERFGYRNIPVVLIDNDLPGSHHLCCVAPHDHMTGRLGAEILLTTTHQKGKILIANGSADSAAHMHNLQGFRDYLNENGNPFELLVIQEYGNYDRCYNQALRLLKEHKDIVAFYSVTARSTLPLCHAVKELGFAGVLRGVGSDLFPESAQLLRDNVVQALIYKNAFDKGMLGFRILFDYVVKNIQPKKTQVTVPISVIMKNNLRFFEKYI
ncbi:LacI family DNA-binding transcriptional regulator [Oscillospiraceae bacterium LTW-04]|nr:LacI family DNA-binding transcriptional regulator [Oscillospiraceae bacterium MB24-C1]